MKEYRVIKSRKAESENPIILNKGEKISCVEESDPNGDWPNWILCESINNKGWIPRQIIDISEDKGIILEDYNAKEFDIDIDEIIVMEKQLNGWIWGYKKNNKDITAWTPLNHLELV